ncbi:LlaJI family restriction endonuclease [Paragemmobacter ruber]|uniref:LlaJI family restriction endonuclease n=1 Tax=Paragemmobacter ruber TaxID=1985673 RepID=A0ABW9YAE5_9RHOB|nr:LlaJI family restriction endonuclease [Rhodobacter ruber]NBE09600.1 LlaJI family restriction endonuclease [Rhodobacter ruber]
MPRAALRNVFAEDLVTAQLTMRTLAKFSYSSRMRTDMSSRGVLGVSQLGVVLDLAADYRDYGIYYETERYPTIGAGKPNWSKTLRREFGFCDENGELCPPLRIRGQRSLDSHGSVLSQVQVAVLREILNSHGWWLTQFGMQSLLRSRQGTMVLPRNRWATLLKQVRQSLYSVRALRLCGLLIEYLEEQAKAQESSLLIGVEDFHIVWEEALRQVIPGVERSWNSLLPVPFYISRESQLANEARAGLRTDIVFRIFGKLMLADAKYYAAENASDSPGISDIVKQQAYQRAIEFIDGKPLAGSMFIFPASQSRSGKFTHIEFRNQSGARADNFPIVSCLYLSVYDVLQNYVNNKTLPADLFDSQIQAMPV